MTNTATTDPIFLNWRQRLAAFWSIWWPCWVATFLAFAFIPMRVLGEAERNLGIFSALAQLLVFGLQAFLVHRLVRKDYRSFNIAVLRNGQAVGRTLSATEGLRVWLRTFWPQALFLAAMYLIAVWASRSAGYQTAKGLSDIGLWLRILAIGPYAIDVAIAGKYRGFRLQAFSRLLKFLA